MIETHNEYTHRMCQSFISVDCRNSIVCYTYYILYLNCACVHVCVCSYAAVFAKRLYVSVCVLKVTHSSQYSKLAHHQSSVQLNGSVEHAVVGMEMREFDMSDSETEFLLNPERGEYRNSLNGTVPIAIQQIPRNRRKRVRKLGTILRFACG